MTNKEYGGLDYFKFAAAFLVVAIHTYPLMSVNANADFILTHIIGRIAVPFFFMVTGFFLLGRDKGINKFIFRTVIIYEIAILLYLPVNFYSGYFSGIKSFWKIPADLFFEGTFYHLWYLPAVILGVCLTHFIIKKSGMRSAIIISSALYIFGLLGDSYYGICRQIPVLDNIYNGYFSIFEYTRNGIFFAPIFLVIGALISKKSENCAPKELYKDIIGLILSLILLLSEGLLLSKAELTKHDSMYISLIPVMFFLFRLILSWKIKPNNMLRKISMIIYIIHPMMIILVRGAAKVLRLQDLLVENSMIHYIMVCILSVCVSVMIIIIRGLFSKDLIKKDLMCPEKHNRSWIEINFENLKHNMEAIKNILPQHCKIMAVVKADAYGHGSIKISRELNKIGINSFAVAMLDEGIALRENNIKGEILILGYTDPSYASIIERYNFIQTVIDYNYAELLNSHLKDNKKKLGVHVKIDTGMNRLGEAYNHTDNILKIFELNKLSVKGTFTHLCVSDSHNKEDVDYSYLQIKSFYRVVDHIQEMGYDPGKLHIQSTYGVLNYPKLRCDYARIGLGLYGVLSVKDNKLKVDPDLRPVMSVKSRVALTKDVYIGETVGYGREYTALRDMRIAIISIGYADGIPRNLSEGEVIINGRKVNIIGRICMDRFAVDITDIPDVKTGDIATIIGREGCEEITCEEVAEKCGTISNEILSRIGRRT